MSWFTILLFIPACFALNMAPGPNNLLSMNNAHCYGIRISCLAGIGRLAAFIGMIALTAMGLASLLYTSELLFNVVKVLGALYLFWLAYQLWRAPKAELESPAVNSRSLFGLMQQEFLLAAGNPKAILIFTAFLPQFVDLSAGNISFQFFILGSLFIAMECIAIFLYALFGSLLRHWFAKPAMKQLFNRSCASLLASAGVGLLFAKRTN